MAGSAYPIAERNGTAARRMVGKMETRYEPNDEGQAQIFKQVSDVLRATDAELRAAHAGQRPEQFRPDVEQALADIGITPPPDVLDDYLRAIGEGLPFDLETLT
jgi:hypothetical protein